MMLMHIQQIEKMPVFSDRVLSAAVYYANQGFYVVPLRPGTKILGPNVDYKDASKEPAQMRRWFGEDCRFEGWNIGLACGMSGGLFALDVDNKGLGEEETISALEAKYGEMEGPVQLTPSGGKHYLFRWRDNGRTSSNLFQNAPGEKTGIDCRGGDSLHCRSHIVAWPSVLDNGGKYTWSKVGELRDTPDFILAHLGKAWKGGKPIEGSNRGNEEIGKEDVETLYALDRIERMMDHINPDDLSYNEWLYVGNAINSQHPDKDGLALWDKWSSSGDRYDANECVTRWHGFDPGGPIRIATLISLAQRGGYDPRTQGIASTDESIQEITDSYNKEYAVIAMGGRVKVMKELNPKKDDIINDRFILMDLPSFKLLVMNDFVVMPDAKGIPKQMPKSDVWLADERRRTYMGLTFEPNKGERVEGRYNIWCGWPIKPIEGDWTLFYKHILDVICSGDNDHCEWLLDWMADLIQDPCQPKGCALVMHGIEGCGKGTFCDVFGELVGRHYKHVTSEEHFTGRFNGFLHDSLLTFADEVTYGGSKKVAGVLKAMVTEKHLVVERKGIDAIAGNNYARIVIASNESWFIPAGPQSRRWFVMGVAGNKANNVKYFAAIREVMNNGGYEALMYAMLTRKITKDLRKAPVTEILEEQREKMASTCTVLDWWSQCVDNGDLDVIPEGEIDDTTDTWFNRVKAQALFESYVRFTVAIRARAIPHQQFNIRMGKLGVARKRVRKPGTQTDAKHVVFIIPSINECKVITKQEMGNEDA